MAPLAASSPTPALTISSAMADFIADLPSRPTFAAKMWLVAAMSRALVYSAVPAIHEGTILGRGNRLAFWTDEFTVFSIRGFYNKKNERRIRSVKTTNNAFM